MSPSQVRRLLKLIQQTKKTSAKWEKIVLDQNQKPLKILCVQISNPTKIPNAELNDIQITSVPYEQASKTKTDRLTANIFCSKKKKQKKTFGIFRFHLYHLFPFSTNQKVYNMEEVRL